MGCDGWIKDPEKFVEIEMRCYHCSRVIDVSVTPPQADAHKHCIGDNGLPVSLDISNYEDR